MGGRVDGVLRRERNWEYLVTEAAKHIKDASQDTKHLKDYFKLARNLRDMLWSLKKDLEANAPRFDKQLIGGLQQGQRCLVYGLETERLFVFFVST